MEDVRAQLPPPLQSKMGGMHDDIARSGSVPKASPSRGAVRSKPNPPSRRRCGSFSRPAPLSWPRFPQSQRYPAGYWQPVRVFQRDGLAFHLVEHRHVIPVPGRRHRDLRVRATRGDRPPEGSSAIHAGASRGTARRDPDRRGGRNHRDGDATEFFVTELTKRQEALAAAKEAAEAARDVAERARAEAAAARADVELTREVLQTVLDNMSDGIVLFDKDYRLKFINHQLMSFQRYPSEVTRPGTSIYDLSTVPGQARRFRSPRRFDRIVQEWAAMVLKPGGNRYERYTASGRHVEFNFKPAGGRRPSRGQPRHHRTHGARGRSPRPRKPPRSHATAPSRRAPRPRPPTRPSRPSSPP